MNNNPTRNIQLMMNDFFIEDIFPALKEIGAPYPEFMEFESSEKFQEKSGFPAAPTKVFANFQRGTEASDIILKREGKPDFEMYLKVNIRHVAVKYFFDIHQFDPDQEEKHFFDTFAVAISGAESVGYTRFLCRRFHPLKKREVLELTLFLNLPGEKFMDPAERLFLRHDIKTMTNSFIRTLDSLSPS